MEIVSFGEGCLRLRGREGVVVADAFPRIVGPTGRGLTADIATYSHSDGQGTLGLAGGRFETSEGTAKRKTPTRRAEVLIPTSLDSAFVLDSPGEYEVHQVLITGVRTFRDEKRGDERGANTCFVYELDGLHVAHLGDLGHVLTEDELGEMGTLDVVCVPIGGSLSAARAAEVVTQLDASLVVAMPLDGAAEMERFLHEMSVQNLQPIPKLQVSHSSLPGETTVVLLEARGKS
jgi:hypothetical protein